MYGWDSPGDQQVLLLQEKDLSDSILVSFQPVQTALVDDIPHNDICILEQRECLQGTSICLCKMSTSSMILFIRECSVRTMSNGFKLRKGQT